MMTKYIDYIFFLRPFLLSISLTVALSVLIIKTISLFKIPDSRCAKRHIHKAGVARFGGVAMIFAFIATLFFDGRLVVSHETWGIIISCVFILIIGIIDDVRQLKWHVQLLMQMCVVLIVLLFGIRLDYISNPFGGIILFSGQMGAIAGYIFISIWLIFLMNSMNWVDGMDGLSGGITAISAITIFFLSLRPDVNQPPVAIIAVTVFGIMLAFLSLNFYPAKILAGTSGSMFMGFILGALGIFAGAKIATTMLVMIIPIIDACWVMYERMRSGRSIFLPDRRHLHYRLKQLGWNPMKICLTYYVVTLLVSYVSMILSGQQKLLAFAAIALFMALALVFVSKKTQFAV